MDKNLRACIEWIRMCPHPFEPNTISMNRHVVSMTTLQTITAMAKENMYAGR